MLTVALCVWGRGGRAYTPLQCTVRRAILTETLPDGGGRVCVGRGGGGGGLVALHHTALYCKKGNTDGDTDGGLHTTLHCIVKRAILMETLRWGGGGDFTSPYIVL